MDLKRLLDEVETARTGTHMRHKEAMARSLDHYEQVLMPDLARRLKSVMRLAKTAKFHAGETCPQRQTQRGM